MRAVRGSAVRCGGTGLVGTACCGRKCAWTAHAEEALQKIGRSTYRGSKIVRRSAMLGRKDGTRWTHRASQTQGKKEVKSVDR